MLTRDGNIDYDLLVGEAMREAYRGVVRTILQDVAANGLRGEHHYYISFYTHAPGVSVSRRLLEKYPAEMTIVLQHKFWDLTVLPDRFEVKLAFNGIPERLVVPYSGLKVFFDPSVRFGHQFEDPEQAGDAPADDVAGTRGRPRIVGAKPDKKRATGPVRKRPEIVGSEIAGNAPSSDDAHVDAKPEAPAAVVNDGSPPQPSAPQPSAPVPVALGPKVVSLDQFRKK